MSRLPFAPPIKKIKVEIETGRLLFRTRAAVPFHAADLRRAIEEAGYAIDAIHVDGAVAQPKNGRDAPARGEPY